VRGLPFRFLIRCERIDTAFAHSSDRFDAGRGLLKVIFLTMLDNLIKGKFGGFAKICKKSEFGVQK
jgi:hypothetical protein